MNKSPSIFSNKNFILLFTSDTISGFGDRMSILALFILLFNLTGRVVDMGVLMIIQAVPAIVIGPLSGVYIDRFSKKKILIVTHFMQAGLTFLIPFAGGIVQVYVIAGCLAVVRQFFNPARLALLPEIVDREDLPRANSLGMMAMNVLLIAGPAAAGIIVSFAGTSPAFFIDAGTFAVAASILFAVVPGRIEAEEEPGGAAEGFTAQFREGMRFMVSSPLLRYLIPFLALVILIGSMQSPLIVVFVKNVLARGDLALGILMSATGVGGILGSILIGIFGSKMTQTKNVARLILADGVLLVLFALNRNFPVGVAIFLLFGTLGTSLHIIIMSLLQARVPLEKRGRVFANLAPVLGPLSIVSIGVGTALADLVGVARILLASGAAECICGAAAPLLPHYRKALKELDEG